MNVEKNGIANILGRTVHPRISGTDHRMQVL
jgi:hypothetical protein